MDLNLQQTYAFQQFKIGANLLVSGPAGTGKSLLISKIKEYTDSVGRNLSITATTGNAAILLGPSAKTIHSWGGFGIGADPAQKIIYKIKYKPRVAQAIKEAHTLVIDEVSMLTSGLMELADEVFRGVREDGRPFGGIQILIFGDFLQLPPVNKVPGVFDFCFKSNLFKKVFSVEKNNMIELTQIYRQQDMAFSRVLNEIRVGELSKEGDALLRTRLNVVEEFKDGIRPTRIFARREAVDELNQQELDKLETKSEMFKMKEVCSTSRQEVCRSYGIRDIDITYEYTAMRKSLLCDNEIELKVGAQVMNIRNTILPDDTLLANGAQGVVITFNNDIEGNLVPVVRFENGLTMQVGPMLFESPNYKNIGLVQIPLRLSWAITIHKAQGATLERAEMDIGSTVFAPGQTYSAISRVRSLGGLYLTAYDPSKIIALQEVKEFYATWHPVVESMLLDEKEVDRLAKLNNVSRVIVERPCPDLFSVDVPSKSTASSSYTFMPTGGLSSNSSSSNERIIPRRKIVDLWSDDVENEPEAKKQRAIEAEVKEVKMVSLAKAGATFSRYKNDNGCLL